MQFGSPVFFYYTSQRKYKNFISYLSDIITIFVIFCLYIRKNVTFLRVFTSIEAKTLDEKTLFRYN